MDAITIARLWLLIRPIRLIRNRRRAKHGLPPLTDSEVSMPEVMKVTAPDGTETTRREPIVPARTSTKAAVGSLLAAYPGIELVMWLQTVDYPWPLVQSFTHSDAFPWVCATLIPVIIARFTRSPAGAQRF